jgi:hypothetical protein
MKARKGKFRPKFPEKYKGDPTNIIYRSSYELKVMNYLDNNKNIIEWSSEEIVIPYICVTDGKKHRYFPDFYVKTRSNDGIIKEMLIEVKPKSQTLEPKKQKRISRKYITEVMAWGKNQAKWKYAKEYCLDRGWEFVILTEYEIFGDK